MAEESFVCARKWKCRIKVVKKVFEVTPSFSLKFKHSLGIIDFLGMVKR